MHVTLKIAISLEKVAVATWALGLEVHSGNLMVTSMNTNMLLRFAM